MYIYIYIYIYINITLYLNLLQMAKYMYKKPRHLYVYMYNWYKAAQSKYYVNDTNDTMEKQNEFLSSFKFFRHGISKISLKMITLETS